MDWMEAIRRVTAFSELAGPITFDQFLKLIPSDTPAEEIERLMVELKAQGIEIAKAKAPTGTGLSCSFCGKTEPEVLQLIAGPGTFICDECIQLCVCMVAVKNPGWLEEHRQLLAKLPLKLNG